MEMYQNKISRLGNNRIYCSLRVGIFSGTVFVLRDKIKN